MDRTTRNRFKDLLIDLPFWPEQRQRSAFVTDIFWNHEIKSRFTAEGNGDLVAGELLDLCTGFDAPTESGESPRCALLTGVREHNLAAGARAAVVTDLSRRLGCTSRKPAWSHDPYPGLSAFQHWQAPVFCGRAVETRDLLRRMETDQGQRFLLVTGASGSGKSSLVRAGVWPALARGEAPYLSGSADWLITAMFPAEQKEQDGNADPFHALTSSLKQHPQLGWLYPGEEADKLKSDPAAFADLLSRALGDLPAGAQWLLVLDQMEELFTPACESSRSSFLYLLLSASELPRFRVIATVRSDFFPSCEAHEGLHAVLNSPLGHYSVKAPGPLAMARMVTGPVEEVDLAAPIELDPALNDRLVEDAVAEPGGLALLAFTLKDLYERCRVSGRMELAAYEHPSFGGLKGVIQRRADRALERAGDDGRAALPRVFSRLLSVQPDGTATRRREDKHCRADDAAAQRVIDEFTRNDTRLLVVGPDDNPTVEVAHEALLREWPTLVVWVEDRREALRLRDKVTEDTRIWVREGRPEARKWRHELLNPARSLLAEADLLSDLQRETDVADFLTPEAECLLTELLCSGTDHARREAIGMRLSEIDVTPPRLGVGVIDGAPDILWRDIPEGQVEIEEHGRFEVAPFRLAAYPVTYAQYRSFLDAEDDYRSDRWWTGFQKESAAGHQLRPYASYPATDVSWYDATAFCRWLSHRLGFEVRLPDEWEWQWAAQSARADFAFPWGPEWLDGVANTEESGIGRTTAVGMYPDGRSLQGVYDLAGNVWEWCRSQYTDPRRTEPGGDESRVLRGGSWLYGRGSARADYRFNYPPNYRGDYYGFRVLCASPIRRALYRAQRGRARFYPQRNGGTMTDTDQLAQALDAVADELEPAVAPPLSVSRRRRGPTRAAPGGEAVLQVVERDGVLQVEEVEPSAPVARRRRRELGATAAREEVRYERKFERLDRSDIGSWLERLDAKLTPRRGLRVLGDGGLEPLDATPMDGRILLLIHGTFSESESFFNGFGENPKGPDFIDWARGHYSHVVTFDHPTLSVSPVLNARALALLLGESQAEIDIVCHSRGGLVTRWWLEVFDRAPPEKRRAVFVGSPLAGTGLAAPTNIRGSLSLLSNIGMALGAASAAVPFLTVLTGLFRVVTSVTKLAANTPAIDAAVALVPGLVAQSRVGNNSEMISLRRAPQALAGRYFAVKSNFESEKPGWQFWRYFRNIGDRTKDSLADLVFEGQNDLVVDTGSMVDLSDELSISTDQVLDFGTTDYVHHTNYFAQEKTLDFIREMLDRSAR